jgi:hypothetical protein
MYMEYNFFEGEVPVEFGNLKELEMLKLVRNLMTGTIPENVCAVFGADDLKHLEVDCREVTCSCCAKCNQPTTRLVL